MSITLSVENLNEVITFLTGNDLMSNFLIITRFAVVTMVLMKI